MKTITEERTYTVTKYVAEDGKEFDTPEKCKAHEEEIIRENLDVSYMECKAAEQFPNFGTDYTSEDYSYKWYKVESEEDIKKLQEKYEFDDYDMKYITAGDYVCIEKTYDDCYVSTLRSGLSYVENLLDKLGFEIEIRQKEN